MNKEEFANLMNRTIVAAGVAKYLTGRYCSGGDMRTVGGETFHDRGPLEVANGEEERLMRELWNAFDEREANR